MKTKKILFTILIGVLTLLGSFGLVNKQSPHTVFAANGVDCFTMILDEAKTQQEEPSLTEQTTTYVANVAVGEASGDGKFTLDTRNLSLTAEANTNFQIVGWKVVYDDQEGVSIFYNSKELESGKKNIVLKSKEGVEVGAEITFSDTTQQGIFNKSTFKLARVFENLTITPVFDHSYYQLENSQHLLFNFIKEDAVVDGNDLYYQAKTTDEDGVTAYENATIMISSKAYYYGTLYSKDGEFYTLHSLLKTEVSGEPVQQRKVDHTKGAFKVGDNVKAEFDVNVKPTLEEKGTNIDVIGVAVELGKNNRVNLDLADVSTSMGYNIEKDEWQRTTKVKFNFNIRENQTAKNSLIVTYHRLYVVTLDVTVDGLAPSKELVNGEPGTSEFDEVLGTIATNNFFSKNQDNTQFLVKKAVDNGSKSFDITCASEIGKYIDQTNYTYFIFDTMDGQKSTKQIFANISEDKLITINYLSQQFKVTYQCLEYEKIGESESLIAFNGAVLATETMKRGTTKLLDTSLLGDVKNYGYEFVGYSLSNDPSKVSLAQQEFELTIDKEKPENTIVYLIYKKIEYSIKFANFNQVKLTNMDGGNSIDVYPLISIGFNVFNLKEEIQSKAFSQTDLESQNLFDTSIKIKLNGKLEISYIKNEGFNIVGFACKQTIDNTSDYFIDDQLELTSEFIANNEEYLQGKEFIVYITEEIEKYTITYKINPTKDDNLQSEVIMANISVRLDDGSQAEIEKFDVQGNVVTDVSQTVVMIVVSNLTYNENLLLTSETKFVGEGTERYYYMFNRFTMDGVTELSKELTEQDYNSKKVITKADHTETVTMSKEITVVYSMPETMLSVQADEESYKSPNFKLNVVISQEGKENITIEGAGSCTIDSKSFSVQVESVFGFELIGYTFNGKYAETSSNTVNILQHEVGTDANNSLILQFKKVEYQFQFMQNGAGNGFVNFGEDDYINLTLDTDQAKLSNAEDNIVSVVITKPEGFFVKNVAFSNDGTMFSSVVNETNEFRNNADKNKFIFQISVQDFETVILTKSTQDGTVIKVLVNLYYEVYTYQIAIQPTISNSQYGKDAYVIMPTFNAVKTGTNEVFKGDLSKGYVEFQQIPYGTAITINLISEPSKGMGKLGFQQTNGNPATYTKDINTLSITKTTYDLTFAYNVYYLPVEIVIEKDASDYGKVDVLVDNISSNSILLFNKLEIRANGNVDRGFVFDRISYHAVEYVEYQHTAELWEELKNSLYIKNDQQQFVLNTNPTYNQNITYYVKENNEIIISSADVQGEIVFMIESFNFDDLQITESNDGKLQVVFKVEFKLLEMTIVNIISENDVNGKLSDAGAYNNQSMLKFNVEEFATFKIVKVDENKYETDISNSGNVTYNDTIKIEIQVNSKAINLIDGEEYDLTFGLKLISVDIYTSTIAFNQISRGKYACVFEMKQHFANLFGQDVIEIEYSFIVEKFTFETTTIVTQSTDFYDNVKLNIDAKVYGFASSSKSSDNEINNGSIVLSQDLQYLATGKTYINLINSYKNDFVIYGINAYLNGNKIKEEDFDLYSIKMLSGEGNENSYIFQIFGKLRIEFLIRPKITFNNNGPQYEKNLKYDAKGYAQNQGITVGTTAKDDLQISSLLVSAVELTYTKEDGLIVGNEVKNAGLYNVDITFNIPKGQTYDWLRNIKVEDQISLQILKKEISLSYDKQNIEQVTKPYDGNSGYNVSNVYQWLMITDGTNFKISFNDAIADGRFRMTQIKSYISTAGKDENGGVKDADETKYYNYYLYDFALTDNEFNNNFHLLNNDLIIEKYIQITRAPLKIQNLQVYSKVYDGSTKAELVEGVKLGILGIIEGDKVSIDNLNNIKLSFEDEKIGTDKKVIVDASDAIVGESAHNYYVESGNVQGLTIYPYKLTVNVQGRGDVELFNERGLTDKSLVALIPIGAELKVVAFKKDSNPYVDIYSKIRSRVRGRNEFVVGYQLVMMYEGNKIPIDSNLYLSIPSIKDLTGAFYLFDNKTGEVTSTTENGRLIIDLQPIEGNIEYVFLIHKRTLLKPWQIVLIVIGSVLVVGGIVVAFIFIRKHKRSKDSVHEKI